MAEQEIPPEAICKSCGGQGVVPVGRPRPAPADARRVPLDELEDHIVTLESRLEEIDHALADVETLRDGDQCRFLKRERERVAIELKPLDAEWLRRAAARVADEVEGRRETRHEHAAPEGPDQGDCRACHGLGIRPPAGVEPAGSVPAATVARGGKRADRAFVSRAVGVLQAYETRAPRGWPRDMVERMLREIDSGETTPAPKERGSRLDAVGNVGLVLAATLLAWALVRLLVRIL